MTNVVLDWCSVKSPMNFPTPFDIRLSCPTIFRWISDIYYDLIITLILLGGFSCHLCGVCSAARILAGRNLPRLRSEESLFFIPSHIKVCRLLKEWERKTSVLERSDVLKFFRGEEKKSERTEYLPRKLGKNSRNSVFKMSHVFTICLINK